MSAKRTVASEGVTSAKRTVYVKEQDREHWEKAAALSDASDESLSDYVTAALRRENERREEAMAVQERLAGQMDRIVVEVTDEEERVVRKGFNGVWLVEDMASSGDNRRAGITYSVAATAKGSIACLRLVDGEVSAFDVFGSLEEAGDEYPGDVLSAAGNELGENFVEELNI